MKESVNLWRCPDCEWVGLSVDGHCRQFDEHSRLEPRIPLEPVVYVSLDAIKGLGDKRKHPWNNDDDQWVEGWNDAIVATVALGEEAQSE